MAQLYLERRDVHKPPHRARGGAGIFDRLPLLTSLSPKGMNDSGKEQTILRLLRQAALSKRNLQPLEFYSMRAVGRHFDVPHTMVIRVYSKLKAEGVLATIWGAKTVVESHTVNKNIRLKAIVGLPASRKRFATSANYQAFFLAFQDALWRQGFGARLIFIEDDADSPNIADNISECGVHIVIQFAPSSKSELSIRQLSDRGIKTLLISDRLPVNGGSGFYLSRRNAFVRAMSSWKSRGIGHVFLLDTGGRAAAVNRRLVENILGEAQMRILPSLEPRAFSTKRRVGNAGVILMTAEAGLTSHCKDTDLTSSFNAVMMFEGDLNREICPTKTFPYETISFEWAPLVRKILANLIARNGREPTRQHVFEADWRERSG
jgi:hypothetical protein